MASNCYNQLCTLLITEVIFLPLLTFLMHLLFLLSLVISVILLFFSQPGIFLESFKIYFRTIYLKQHVRRHGKFLFNASNWSGSEKCGFCDLNGALKLHLFIYVLFCT